jgi:hypothetical protein
VKKVLLSGANVTSVNYFGDFRRFSVNLGDFSPIFANFRRKYWHFSPKIMAFYAEIIGVFIQNQHCD